MNTDNPSTRLALRAMVTAAWQAQCAAVAAELDLPARLADGPATSAGLAAASGAHEPSLRRLLRTLTAMQIQAAMSVLHDWTDDEAVEILASCHQANPAATLIIVERVLPEQVTPGDLEALLTDLNMLVLLGGQERTQAEFTSLLGRAGYALGQIISTPGEFSIIEAFSLWDQYPTHDAARHDDGLADPPPSGPGR